MWRQYLFFFILLNALITSYASNFLPSDKLVGKWKQENKNMVAIKQIEVQKNTYNYFMEVWGECDGKPCNWGNAKLYMLGKDTNAAAAIFETKKETKKVSIVLNKENKLECTVETTFKTQKKTETNYYLFSKSD